MAYYKHENYFSEADMKGWSEERKAGQRELNWDLRLEHYAVHNPAMFVKMTDEWAARYKTAGVPTMKVLYILKLARQNGIASNNVIRFVGVEERIMTKCPGMFNPADVEFNFAKSRENFRAGIYGPALAPKKKTVGTRRRVAVGDA